MRHRARPRGRAAGVPVWRIHAVAHWPALMRHELPVPACSRMKARQVLLLIWVGALCHQPWPHSLKVWSIVAILQGLFCKTGSLFVIPAWFLITIPVKSGLFGSGFRQRRGQGPALTCQGWPERLDRRRVKRGWWPVRRPGLRERWAGPPHARRRWPWPLI